MAVGSFGQGVAVAAWGGEAMWVAGSLNCAGGVWPADGLYERLVGRYLLTA